MAVSSSHLSKSLARATSLAIIILTAILFIASVYKYSINSGKWQHRNYTAHILAEINRPVSTSSSLKSMADVFDAAIAENKKFQSLLFDSVRILCAVMVSPQNTKSQDALWSTWGKRCNTLVYLIGQSNVTSPGLVKVAERKYFLVVKMEDRRQSTWRKVHGALKLLQNSTLADTFDWLFRVDDDAYIIMENLRLLLLTFDANTSVQIGSHYKMFGGYIGTGPGIAISRTAYNRLMTVHGTSKCQASDTHDDDLRLGQCLRQANVPFGKSGDEFGRLRFSPFRPEVMMFQWDKPPAGDTIPTWYRKHSADMPIPRGANCCSDGVVGYHYMKPEDIMLMDFMLYRANPFFKE